MAKNIDHILHKKSNVVNSGVPKAPTSGSVEYGEIAVNYAADNETLFIRNSNDQVVPFARVTVEDMERWDTAASGGITNVEPSGMSASIANNTLTINTNATKVKLDDFTHNPETRTTAYTNESAVTSDAGYDTFIESGTSVSVNDALAALENEIINIWKMLGKKDFDKNFYGSSIYKLWDDTERVLTEGLVDLDDRVSAHDIDINEINSSITEIAGDVEDISGTVQTISGTAQDAVTAVTASGMTASIANNTLDINTNAVKVKLDEFTHDPENATSAYTNESAVTEVSGYSSIITSGNTGFSGVSVNDALAVLEKEIINIWKMLGKKDFDKDSYGTSVYDIIIEDERVTAEGFVDLDNRVNDNTSDIEDISGLVETVTETVETISGTVKTISGDVQTISGTVQTISGSAQNAVTAVTSSGMSASIANNTLTINTNATKVKLDDFTHDAQNATTAYTNESAVTSSSGYSSIISGSDFTAVSVNNALAALEKEIINIWKMLGKNEFDKEFYGTSIYTLLDDTDRVVAEALVDLDTRVVENTDTIGELESSVTAATGDLETLSGAVGVLVSGGVYDSTSQKILLKNNSGGVVSEIDARDFIKDGMIESVEILTTGGTSYLVITWNTDAGGQVTTLDIGDIFEASNYYTTAETSSSTEIHDGFSSVTNDVSTLSGTVQTISGTVQSLSGNAISAVTTSSMTTSITSNNLTINTSGNQLKIDSFTHDAQNATSAYTNESAVTSSSGYSSIISGTPTSVTINSALSSLEKEIINLWKMLGKKDFDKDAYGTSIYDIITDNEHVTAEAFVYVQGNIETLSGVVSGISGVSGDIQTLSGDVSSISSSVTTVSGTVGSHETRIQALETAVSGLTNDLSNLTQRVNDMALVISAALNDINSRICS